MLVDELYDVLLANVKTCIEEKVNGSVSVTRDDRNVYVTIINRGYWNYPIYNFDYLNVNEIDAKSIAKDILRRHSQKISDAFFRSQ